jgi:hypothetical protein
MPRLSRVAELRTHLPYSTPDERCGTVWEFLFYGVRSGCGTGVPLRHPDAGRGAMPVRVPECGCNGAMGRGRPVGGSGVQPVSHNGIWMPWITLKEFRRVEREYSLWSRARKRQRELRRRHNERKGGAVYVVMGEREP